MSTSEIKSISHIKVLFGRVGFPCFFFVWKQKKWGRFKAGTCSFGHLFFGQEGDSKMTMTMPQGSIKALGGTVADHPSWSGKMYRKSWKGRHPEAFRLFAGETFQVPGYS